MKPLSRTAEWSTGPQVVALGGGHGLAAQDALKDHCVFFRSPVYGFAFLARLFGGYSPADGRKFAPKLFFEFFEFHKKMPNQTPGQRATRAAQLVCSRHAA